MSKAEVDAYVAKVKAEVDAIAAARVVEPSAKTRNAAEEGAAAKQRTKVIQSRNNEPR